MHTTQMNFESIMLSHWIAYFKMDQVEKLCYTYILSKERRKQNRLKEESVCDKTRN